MEETQAQKRPKIDGKDRLIGQLENQRNGALTQSAIFGAERDALAEALQEKEQELAMAKLHNQALKHKVDELTPKDPPEAPVAEPEAATVAPPAANDAPAAGTTAEPATGTEG